MTTDATDTRSGDLLEEVDTGTRDVERMIALLDEDQAGRVRVAEAAARETLAGRTIWNVNSTARGGGVAEMLYPLVAYARGTGVDVRWLVMGGVPEFFELTKRIHNRLHGAGGSGSLDGGQRALYDSVLAPIAAELLTRVKPGDLVLLHDPQTAGLAPSLADAGVPVVWRCHVGIDQPNDHAREAWHFLAPYVSRADAFVFSRREYAWDVLDPARVEIVAPSIDPLAPKNQDLARGRPAAILAAAGLRDHDSGAEAVFEKLDGSRGYVHRRAHLDEDRPLTRHDRYVLQVSRWDRLKDPLGVIDGFATHVAPDSSAHLVYAGPDVTAVADDPEGARVYEVAREHRDALPEAIRERVHLAMLPMDDLEENAAIVNALQREAAVIVQKSLAEGFGLTVAEAMWKERPVVGSRVGGIQDQIEHDVSGVLVDDPGDLAEYGSAVLGLLRDGERSARIGAEARRRVTAQFLGTHSLLDYLTIIVPLLRHDTT